jgi:hypothetical protein
VPQKRQGGLPTTPCVVSFGSFESFSDVCINYLFKKSFPGDRKLRIIGSFNAQNRAQRNFNIRVDEYTYKFSSRMRWRTSPAGFIRFRFPAGLPGHQAAQ